MSPLRRCSTATLAANPLDAPGWGNITKYPSGSNLHLRFWSFESVSHCCLLYLLPLKSGFLHLPHPIPLHFPHPVWSSGVGLLFALALAFTLAALAGGFALALAGRFKPLVCPAPFLSFLSNSFCKASASKSSCVLVPSLPLSLSKVKGVLASFFGGS